MNEVLLRGCTMKNSGKVHGVVIYTGPESRIQMNAASPPKKTGVLSSKRTLHNRGKTIEQAASELRLAWQ